MFFTPSATKYGRRASDLQHGQNDHHHHATFNCARTTAQSALVAYPGGFSGCLETPPPRPWFFLNQGVTPLLAPTLTCHLHLRLSETPLQTNSGYATEPDQTRHQSQVEDHFKQTETPSGNTICFYISKTLITSAIFQTSRQIEGLRARVV